MVATTSNSVMPFLGPDVAATYDAARVVILPIPLRGNDHIAVAVKWPRCDSGVSSGILRRGTGLGNLSMLVYTHAAVADTRNQHTVPSEEMLQITQKTV